MNPPVQQHDGERVESNVGQVIAERTIVPHPAIDGVRGVHQRAERGVDEDEVNVGQIGERSITDDGVVIVVDERIVERVEIGDARPEPPPGAA